MITLTAEATKAIELHAREEYDNECVGLLIGTIDGDHKKVVDIYKASNTWQGQVSLGENDNADSRQDRFYLDPREYLRAERAAREQGLDIVGCYHSHPDHPAIPSGRDLVGAQGVGGGPGFSFIIQSVVQGGAGEVRSWLLMGEGSRFEPEELTVEIVK